MPDAAAQEPKVPPQEPEVGNFVPGGRVWEWKDGVTKY